jgi:formylglycine-generating enzyme required for sulfatase activity
MTSIPAGRLSVAWQEREQTFDTIRDFQDGIERITRIDTMSVARMRKKLLTSPGFLISTFEITQEQYEAVMSNNPSYFQGRTLPVENVSYEDAEEFCRRLCLLEGVAPGTYRLPTENEWEYACRAGNGADYSPSSISPEESENSPKRDSAISDIAWFRGNSSGRTHTVGLKLPNYFGIYDMHGNVAEWIAGGSARVVVAMGGSWHDRAFNVRSSSRLSLQVWTRPASQDKFTNYIGFRIIR